MPRSLGRLCLIEAFFSYKRLLYSVTEAAGPRRCAQRVLAGRPEAAHVAIARSTCTRERGYVTCMLHARRNSAVCAGGLRHLSTGPADQAGASPAAVEASKTKRTPEGQPSRVRIRSTLYSAAERLGLLGTLGFFGKRAVLLLSGKSAAFGMFSVVSLKKLLFFPAWLWIAAVSSGAPARQAYKNAGNRTLTQASLLPLKQTKLDPHTCE